MEYNIRFRYNALGVFNSLDGNSYSNRLIDNLSLDTNNVYKLNLVVNIKEDEIEIPVVAREHFEGYISSKMLGNLGNVDKLILPLYDNLNSHSRRTFDSILRHIFSISYDGRLQKIITNKGEVCYGGKGIILDENFNPLLMCTLLTKIRDYEGENKRVYYRPVCYVHPKVFEEPTKLIHKGIITKLIPLYTNTEILTPNLYGNRLFLNCFEDKKVKVVIDNFDRFFTRPVKPTPSTCSNEVLNECLVDNIEDIIMML